MAIKQVRVKVNGAWTTATLQADGTYKATLAAPNVTSYNVNSGHYYPVTVEATNMAETATTVDDTHATLGSSLRLRVKEITAPTITVTSPTAGQYFGTSTPTFEFNVTDEANGSGVATSTISIKVDSTTYTSTSSGVTVTSITNGYKVQLVVPTALSDGSHTVVFSASDNDGNAASTVTRTFTTDTVAPTLSVTSPAADGGYTSNSSFTVAGATSDSTSGVPTVAITLNGSDVGSVTVSSGAFSKAVTLTNGTNTIVVTATDKAGKTTTITRTIILDTSAPVIASVVISPNPVNVGANYTVTISVTE